MNELVQEKNDMLAKLAMLEVINERNVLTFKEKI